MDGENIATIVTACVGAIAAITAAYLSSGSKKSSTDTKGELKLYKQDSMNEIKLVPREVF